MTYTFGSVHVDADARRVSNGTGPVHLTRKALDLLLLLLEHRPNAVSTERIHARIWPDTFVSESSVHSLIHDIRQAIDDRAARESCILTVHGIGYRFAETVGIDDRPAAPARSDRAAGWLLGPSARVALHAGDNVVGRGLDDVVEIEAPTISRQHARITIGDAVTIEDLGSKNGTWVGDRRLVAPGVLSDGDTIRLGSVALTFRLARNATPTESVREPAGSSRKRS